MQQTPIPTSFARAAMRLMPAEALQKSIDALLRIMRGRHPRLFKNLEKLKPSVVLVEPTDVPHAFELRFGSKDVGLNVCDDVQGKYNARIKGDLQSLLDMLEGREDGDHLFFARDIVISGDTATIVALRNTLDREEIDLLSDITYGLGPFERPAQILLSVADAMTRHVRKAISDIVERKTAAQNRELQDSVAKLTLELEAMNARLAALEMPKRKRGAA